MRLRLYLTDEWTITDQPHQRIAIIPGATPARPAALLAWGRLAPAVPDEGAILPSLLGVELGANRLVLEAPEPQTTIDGWKYVVQSAQVVAGETVVEERLAALFSFAEYRGAVIARSFDIARWPAFAATIRKAFSEATPDWRGDGEVVCVAHLYEPVVD